MFTRYAIYFLPGGRLADVGARWLGWDMVTGTSPQPLTLGLDILKLTKTPRKYGFHATIKPPFRLAPGQNEAGLSEACADLCQSLAAVKLDGLSLKRMGRMLALVPIGEQAGIRALAAEVVQGIDLFRAPMSRREMEGRQKPWLSPAEIQNLRDWGYPYVMDQFRFHLTLTGSLKEDEANSAVSALEPELQGLISQPIRIDNLSLVGEQPDGFFREIRRFDLTGAN